MVHKSVAAGVRDEGVHTFSLAASLPWLFETRRFPKEAERLRKQTFSLFPVPPKPSRAGKGGQPRQASRNSRVTRRPSKAFLCCRLGDVAGVSGLVPKGTRARIGSYVEIDAFWSALWANWTALGLCEKNRHRYLLRTMRTLVWLVKTYFSRGPAFVAESLKSASLELRTSALVIPKPLTHFVRKVVGNGPSCGGYPFRKWCGQASHLARALPRKSTDTKPELESHRQRLGSPRGPDAPAGLLEWSVQWGKTHRPKHSFRPPMLSGSAELFTSCRAGGRLAALNALREKLAEGIVWEKEDRSGLQIRPSFVDQVPEELLWDLRNPCGFEAAGVSSRGHPPEWVNVDEWRSAVLATVVTKHCLSRLRFAFDSGEVPMVRGAVVTERGWKSRVVTAAPIRLLVAGDYLRKMAFSALRHWEPVSGVLAGDKAAALRSITKKGPLPGSGSWISTDLTEATDWASQAMAQTIWNGLSLAWKLNETCRKAGLVLLGEALLLFPEMSAQAREAAPDGFVHRKSALAKTLGTPVTRGILMGSPLTWFILSLSQGFAADVARRALSTRVPVLSWDRTYRVCGDDLAAWWPVSSRTAYLGALDSMGYKVSFTKTFISKFGGVFTEVLFRSAWTRGHKPHDETKAIWIKRSAQTYLEAVKSRVDREGQQWVNLTTRKPRISLLGVVPFGTVPLKLFLPPVGEMLPRWSIVGPGCLELAKTGNPEVISHLGSSAYRTLGVRLRMSGVVPEAPRSLGGGCLPWCSTNTRACRTHRKAAVALATGAGGIDCSILSRPWSVYTASDWWELAQTMVESVSRGQEPSLDRPDETGWYPEKDLPLGTRIDSMPVDEYLTSQILIYASTLKSQLGADPDSRGPRGPQYNAVVRSVTARAGELSKFAFWAKPGKNFPRLSAALETRRSSYLVPPSCRHYVGRGRKSLAGIQHPAGRRAAYSSLCWNALWLAPKKAVSPVLSLLRKRLERILRLPEIRVSRRVLSKRTRTSVRPAKKPRTLEGTLRKLSEIRSGSGPISAALKRVAKGFPVPVEGGWMVRPGDDEVEFARASLYFLRTGEYQLPRHTRLETSLKVKDQPRRRLKPSAKADSGLTKPRHGTP